MNLARKKVLILGGGGEGIGAAITRTFAAAGASLVIADQDGDRAALAARLAHGHLGDAWGIKGDVRSPAELETILTASLGHLGGLDVLVTVVGGQVAFVPTVRLHEMTDQAWDTMYELNLRYVARAVRLVVGTFLSSGTRGSIVSVGSVTGFMAAPGQAAYGAAKAGLLSLARTVAAEYAAEGIRMNVVAAGAIATAAANPGADGSWVDEIPLGRYGAVDDVATAAAYLASDESSYITGQQIIVDGGVSVKGPFS